MQIPIYDQVPWWKRTTVYQIYPRSFQDSNGDGIGDLNGIISRLDYLKSLGIETIWFSPFYTSPQRDLGYDIADYENIAPEYGDISTIEKLISEIHARNMKIVLDMVMNHTSDQHPWFIESRSNQTNPKRDWYIWRDGKKPHGKAPPNNWRAMIMGSAWHYDPTTDQWYYSQFLPFQPDLNYRNPEVKQKMFDTVRFWLRKGADGFRLDIIHAIYEDPQFRNSPFVLQLFPNAKNDNALFRSPQYMINHPDTVQFVKELRAVIDEFSDPPRFLVGEAYGSISKLREYCGLDSPNGLNMVFLSKTIKTKLEAQAFRKLIIEFEQIFPDPYIPTWVFGNHDVFRRISLLENDPQKMKLNIAFQLTIRGVPYIYYGEEIGIPQSHFPIKSSLDALAHHLNLLPQWMWDGVWRFLKQSINRDECRTPMQWNSTPNAGFCLPTVKPWLPITANSATINVQTEETDPNSLYNCYRRFLAARNRTPPLQAGMLQLLEFPQHPKDLLSFTRTVQVGNDMQKVYVLLNFSSHSLQISTPIPSPSLIVSTLSTSKAIVNDEIVLFPFEGIVIR